MALIFKKKEEAPKIGRIQKIETSELTSWANTSIMNLGAVFDAWRYRNHPIEDVVLVVDNLAAMIHELKNRVDDQPTGV